MSLVSDKRTENSQKVNTFVGATCVTAQGLFTSNVRSGRIGLFAFFCRRCIGRVRRL
jgi:hypothetical protein